MVIDFHTHILPGVDDGSESVKESLRLLKMEALQGVEHVVATPHFYPQSDSPDRFFERRAEAEKRLREAMVKRSGLPRLSVGAEVYFFQGMSDSDIVSGLTIDGKRCILIEMPPPPWSERMYVELEDIRSKWGITPIIAHIDRYIRPFATYHIPERLEELPVIVQANASFFIRLSTRRMALKMLRKHQIHLLGSDCHNLRTRQPNLNEAVKMIEHHLGKEAIQRIKHYEKAMLY